MIRSEVTMSEYVFYPERADGVSLTLDCCVLESEQTAVSHARRLLREHRKAARVVVWRDDIRLVEVPRSGNGSAPMLIGA
jgi:hypothetical protein